MKDQSVIELFRAVGQQELDRVAAANYRTFPTQPPEQPIFYPLLTRRYAEQIARNWSAKDPGSNFRGYVLRFRVRADYLSSFQVHAVGGTAHQEY